MPRTRKGPVVNRGEVDAEKLTEFKLNKNDKKKAKKDKSKNDVSLSKSPVKFLASDCWDCKKCKKSSSDSQDEEWMECDRCTGKYHRSCTNLTIEQFSFLHKSPHDDFKWFCLQCQEEEGKLDPTVGCSIAQQTTQVEALIKVVMSLHQLNTQLVEQNSKIIELLKGKKGVDEDIKIHVEEVMQDQRERDEKKNNIIIYNVPEGIEEDDEKNSKNDIETTKEVFKVVNPQVVFDKVDSTRIQRIGIKKGKGVDSRPRPIKVVMNSPENKMDILRNARKLKDSEKFNQVGLSFDKTRREQEQYRQLKAKLEEKRKSAGPGEDYIIYRGAITLRSEIPNMIRKAKEAAGTGWSSAAPIGGNPGGEPNSNAVGKGSSTSEV